MAGISAADATKEPALPAGRGPAGQGWTKLLRSKSARIAGPVLSVIIASALFAPLVSPYDPIKTSQRTSLEAPSSSHPMGTDRFGRDVLARVLWGGRTALLVGFVSAMMAAIVG